jgi:hypothetical protein
LFQTFNRFAPFKTFPTRLVERGASAIAVGSLGFVEQVKRQLGIRAMHRDLIGAEGSYALRESHEAYGVGFIEQIEPLSSANGLLWNESIHDLTT